MIFKCPFVLLLTFFLAPYQSIAKINNYFINVQYIKPQNEIKLNTPLSQNQKVLQSAFVTISRAHQKSEPALRNCDYLTRWGAPNPSPNLLRLVKSQIPKLINDISACSASKHGFQLTASDVNKPAENDEESLDNLKSLLLSLPVSQYLVPPKKKDDLNFCIRYEVELQNTYDLISLKLDYLNNNRWCDSLEKK